MDIEDIYRLKECRAFIEEDNIDYQRERLKVYSEEIDHLNAKNAFTAIDRLFTTVSPVISAVVDKFSKDSAIAVIGINLLVNQQKNLQKQNDYDSFTVLTKQLLAIMERDTAKFGAVFTDCLKNTSLYIKQQTEGEHFAKAEALADLVAPYSPHHEWLLQNLQWAYGTAMMHHWDNNWEEVLRIGRKQKALDVHGTSKHTIESNLEGAYCNWASTCMNRGDWPKAREILKDCIAEFEGGETKCASILKELENSHSF
jgi:hypothetical protein